MADTAFTAQYKREFTAAFEQRQSLLRNTVTTEAMIEGQTATFLVAGSGGATAQTRGVNGLIPARADDNNQYTATLVEWHDLVRKTRFNVFASQGNQTAIMQKTTMSVMNRKFDEDILSSLSSATQSPAGGAQTMSLDYAMHIGTILGNNEVDITDGMTTFVITPAAYAYLMQTKEFTSADYVNAKPFTGQPMMFRWALFNWIVHPNLTGKGTATETCYAYHRDAIGHAFDVDALNQAIGYNDEQDYSYARCSAFMGGKILQNSGIVKFTHDGSAYAAA